MTYAYDLVLNFQYPLFDIYEWDSSDTILDVKKIPLYKVDSKDLRIFKNCKFKLNDLSGSTKISNSKGKYISYIFTDGVEAVAFNFSKEGYVIGKSRLLPDEELEIIENSVYLKKKKIKYKCFKKDKIYNFKTRKQIEVIKYLINYIKSINDIDELRYVSYECLDKFVLKNELIKDIKGNWDDKYYKIYDFFKSIPMNKV